MLFKGMLFKFLNQDVSHEICQDPCAHVFSLKIIVTIFDIISLVIISYKNLSITRFIMYPNEIYIPILYIVIMPINTVKGFNLHTINIQNTLYIYTFLKFVKKNLSSKLVFIFILISMV